MGILSTTAEFFKIHTYVYDTPDGSDCLKKTIHSSKTIGMLGSWVALMEMVLRSHPVTLSAVGARYIGFVAPSLAAGAAFATVSGLAGQFRGVDGGINHALGGAAAGMMFGVKAKNVSVAVIAGTFLAIIFSVKKEMDKGMKEPNASRVQLAFTGGQPYRQVYGALGHHDRYFGPKYVKAPEPTNY